MHKIPRCDHETLAWAIRYIKCKSGSPRERIVPTEYRTVDVNGNPCQRPLWFKDWFEKVPEHLPVLEACLYHDSTDLLQIIMEQARIPHPDWSEPLKSLPTEALKWSRYVRLAQANLAYHILMFQLWPTIAHEAHPCASSIELDCDAGIHLVLTLSCTL